MVSWKCPEHQDKRESNMYHWLATVSLVVILIGLGCGKHSRNERAAEVKSGSARTDNEPSAVSASVDESEKILGDFDSLVAQIRSTIEEAEKTEAEPFDPPLTEQDIHSVLQQCIHFVLTDPELKDSREFYGTAGRRDVVLVGDWPAGFKPRVPGLVLRFAVSDTRADAATDRVLGIRLSKLDVRAPSEGIIDGNVTLTLTNVGGLRNGAVVGGCFVNFVVRREGEQVVAHYSGLLDP